MAKEACKVWQFAQKVVAGEATKHASGLLHRAPQTGSQHNVTDREGVGGAAHGEQGVLA